MFPLTVVVQYVGGDENTVPWEKAPTAVNRALDLIKQRIQEAELSFAPDFNEVLTAAYMEKQKMAVSQAASALQHCLNGN